jgi:hypothetical protein
MIVLAKHFELPIFQRIDALAGDVDRLNDVIARQAA